MANDQKDTAKAIAYARSIVAKMLARLKARR